MPSSINHAAIVYIRAEHATFLKEKVDCTSVREKLALDEVEDSSRGER